VHQILFLCIKRSWSIKIKMIPTQSKGCFRITNESGIIRLMESDFEWMGTYPDEFKRHEPAITAVSGNVLIGGLGLGYITEQICKKPSVTSVTIVEISPEVIELVWPYIEKEKAEIIQDDIFNYLRKTEREFDFMCFDVHRDISFEQNQSVVKPLRRLAETKLPPDRIFQWRESDMKTFTKGLP